MCAVVADAVRGRERQLELRRTGVAFDRLPHSTALRIAKLAKLVLFVTCALGGAAGCEPAAKPAPVDRGLGSDRAAAPSHEGSDRSAGKPWIEALDTNGDGTISEAERAAPRKARAAEIQARLDTDGDGTVSEAERAVGLAQRAAGREQHVADLRARFDANGDGTLTPAELEASGFRHVEPLADTDHDGDISQTELAAALNPRGRWSRGGEGSGAPAVTPPK